MLLLLAVIAGLALVAALAPRSLWAAALPLLMGVTHQLWREFGAIEAAAGLPASSRFEAVALVHRDAAALWPALLVLAGCMLLALPWGERRFARFSLIFGSIQVALLGTALALVHALAAGVPYGHEVLVWRAAADWLVIAQAVGAAGIAIVTLLAAWLEPDRRCMPWLALPLVALPAVTPNLHGAWLDTALWSP